jgi:hypothetical protein
MPNMPDGVYNRKPWVAPLEAAYPPQEYLGPFASNQERLLSQALASQTMLDAEIQEYVRPPLPQIELFPARYGYVTTEYGINDIIEVSGRVPQRNESDYSQTPNTQESTSRNTLGGSI